MNILFVVHSVSWKGGGAFFHALHLAKELVQCGHGVSILATSPHNHFWISEEMVGGVRLIESPDLLKGAARNGWDPWNTVCRVIYLILKGRQFDVVQCLDCRPVVIFPGLIEKYLHGSKLVLEWLDWFGKGGTATERRQPVRFFMVPVETFFEERFREFADGTIGLGKPLTDRAVDMGIRTDMLTITHGCDTEEIMPVPHEDARKLLGLDPSGFYIGYTGRLREDAAILFIETIRLLRKEFGEKVQGLLIGNTAFDVGNLLDKSCSCGIMQTGWIDYEKVNLYLSSCNVMLLPFSKSVARNSIWPSKVNDYLSAGRPIVSTRLDVLSPLFSGNQIGILCDPVSADFTRACSTLLRNEALAIEMGQKCRELAETQYAWKQIGTSVEAFYQKLMQRSV